MKLKKSKDVGRPRSFDPIEAPDRAMQVFWRKGYLGSSIEELTEAMDINRPSLYATFGNKRALFRKALDRYFSYLDEALKEPTARRVIERVLNGVVDMLTKTRAPGTCMWVHGALSCGGDPLRKEFSAQRAAGLARLSARLKRAVAEGDLPADTEANSLALLVQTINFGLTVQASTGASRRELLGVVQDALRLVPK